MSSNSGSATPPKPSLALRLFVLMFAVVLTAAVAELALQVADFPKQGFSPWVRDSTTGYRYAADLETRMSRAPEYDVAFATNGDGLRDDEVGPKTGKRVLLLGDSFTSGYGVERGPIFADLLEERLGVEVINAGVGGWELVHQVHYLPEAVAAYQPDLVVYICYLGNDLALNDEWEERAEGLRNRTKTFPLRPPVDLKLPALARGVVYGMRQKKAEKAGVWQPFPEYLSMVEKDLGAEGQARWDQASALLLELAEQAKVAKVNLVVGSFSYRTAVEAVALEQFQRAFPVEARLYDFALARSRFEVAAGKAGLETFSLDPALIAADRSPDDLLYFPIDGHWTERGHSVVAGVLAHQLPRHLAP